MSPAGRDHVRERRPGAVPEAPLRRSSFLFRLTRLLGFSEHRCPVCGRPEKPHIEVWKNGGVKRVLPRQCQYCQATLEGIEGEENDH